MFGPFSELYAVTPPAPMTAKPIGATPVARLTPVARGVCHGRRVARAAGSRHGLTAGGSERTHERNARLRNTMPGDEDAPWPAEQSEEQGAPAPPLMAGGHAQEELAGARSSANGTTMNTYAHTHTGMGASLMN